MVTCEVATCLNEHFLGEWTEEKVGNLGHFNLWTSLGYLHKTSSDDSEYQ